MHKAEYNCVGSSFHRMNKNHTTHNHPPTIWIDAYLKIVCLFLNQLIHFNSSTCHDTEYDEMQSKRENRKLRDVNQQINYLILQRVGER